MCSQPFQTPGGIIPFRWAASFRNGGRHHPVMVGDIISESWAASSGISILLFNESPQAVFPRRCGIKIVFYDTRQIVIGHPN